MRRKLLEAGLAMALVAAPSGAFAAQVTVSDPWFRALPSNLPAGGYFTLHNTGKSDVFLTGASSVACGMLMLHKSNTMGGMAMMENVVEVPVPVGGTTKFTPGSFHLMCTSPTAAMTPGGKVGVTFKFSDGSTLSTDFVVKNAKGE